MFDIYVNGIDPNRADEIDSIRDTVSKKLNVSGDNLELLLFPDGKVLIQENTSEQEAIQIQKQLIALGLLCTYQQQKNNNWSNFSLVPKEETLFTCPACQHQQAIQEDYEPETCPACNISLEEYRIKDKQRQEYEAAKKAMLAKEKSRIDYENQQRLKESLELKKNQLEQQIQDELGIKKKSPGKDDKKIYVIAGAAIIGIAVAAAVLPTQPTDSSIPNNAGAEQKSTVAQSSNPVPMVASDESVDGKNAVQAVEANAAELPDTADFDAASSLSGNRTLTVQPGETPSQAALDQGYKNVNTFLSSMGLAKKLPDTSTTAANNKTQQPPTRVPATTTNALSALANSAFNQINNDAAWDNFLAQETTTATAKGQLKTAHNLAQQQASLSKQIKLLGTLIVSFHKRGRSDLINPVVDNLLHAIALQPTESKPLYLAELGVYLQKTGIKNETVDSAQTQVHAITNPILKNIMLAKIAIIHKAHGQLSVNADLQAAQASLNSADASTEKLEHLIDLSIYYAQHGDTLNAKITLISSELLLSTLNTTQTGRWNAALLNAAYWANDANLISNYSAKLTAAEQSRIAYQQLTEQLGYQSPFDYQKALDAISDPALLTVAYTLAAQAEANSDKQSLLLTAAAQKRLTLEDPVDRAITTSKVARLSQLFHLDNQAATLFEQAQVMAQAIADKDQRNATLIVIVNDKARSLLIAEAEKTATLISDSALQTETLDSIKGIAVIKAKLSH